MDELGVQVSLYNRNKNSSKYSSYKGTVGKIAENLLEQDFKQAKPYIVLHTDITQIRLVNHDGLISQLLPTRPARKF
ncbi:hypothetical protein PDA01_15910 [Pediococcus damnosus]|nr:hypothetical protein PDA01_15910 [Pediococcus damnosus]